MAREIVSEVFRDKGSSNPGGLLLRKGIEVMAREELRLLALEKIFEHRPELRERIESEVDEIVLKLSGIEDEKAALYHLRREMERINKSGWFEDLTR